MDAQVTNRAILIPRISHVVRRGLHWNSLARPAESAGSVVTLEAKRSDRGTAQQARIGGTVGAMTGFTPVGPHCSVFECKRAALIRMTANTGLLSIVAGARHARPDTHPPTGRRGAMRIVAIGAGHEALIDAVLERHRELRSNGVVAAVTEIRLRLGEKELRSLRLVNGVTSRTHDIVAGMD